MAKFRFGLLIVTAVFLGTGMCQAGQKLEFANIYGKHMVRASSDKSLPDEVYGGSFFASFGADTELQLLLYQLQNQKATAKPEGKTIAAPYRDVALLPDSRESWLLREARTMIEVGKFDRAIESMNEAFSLNPDAMVGFDEEEFMPIAKACRLLLKQMPQDALNTYRLLADPIAAAKLEQWRLSADRKLLQEIYRGSFFSSFGDDAAFLIGCSYLDEGRYPEAIRMLTDAAFTHPDCSLKPEELLPRLALAAHRSGDLVGAKQAWQQYKTVAEVAPHWRAIGQTLKESAPASQKATKAGVFGETLSGESKWLVAWTLAGQFDSAAVRRMLLQKTYSESAVLVDGDTAYHRGEKLTSIRLRDGKANWRSEIGPRRARRYCGRQQSIHNWPKMMISSLAGRVMVLDAYPIEYCWTTFAPNSLVAMDAKTGKPAWRVGTALNYYQGNQAQHIGGSISLASDGKTPSSWVLPGRRFRATPVPWRDRLLVLYEGTEGFVLAALGPRNGIPIWQTRLSSSVDEGRLGALRMATDSLNAYISNANGDIAAVDATTGTPLWYFRGFHRQVETPSSKNGKPVEKNPDEAVNPDGPGDGTASGKEPGDVTKRPGWLDTQVLLSDELLLAFPTSHPFIVAFNKRNGKRRWMVLKPEDTDYVVGQAEGLIVVAGHSMVRAFSVKDGKEMWSSACEMAIGRGFVSGGAVFIPVGHSVRKLSVTTGKLLATLNVVAPANVPVTTIHPYKNDLLVATPNELYRVYDATRELRDLHARIARKPVAKDLLHRGQIRTSVGEHKDAIRDLHTALAMLSDKKLRKTARDAIVTAFGKAKFADPSKWFELVRKHDFDDRQRVLMSWMEGQHLEQSGKQQQAFEIYRSILDRSGEIYLPGEPGNQTWLVRHEQATWARLQAIASANDDLRPSVARLRDELKARARGKASQITRLMNLDLDLVDADMLRTATADLEAKKLPGVAALVCRRVMQYSKTIAAKRAATIRYFQLMGRRLLTRNLKALLEQIEKEDGDWLEKTLKPELRCLKVMTEPPTFQGNPLDLELAWKATGGTPIGTTSEGILCVDYRKRSVRSIDPQTGRILWNQQLKNTQTPPSHRGLGVIAESRNKKVQFIDSISLKVFHQIDGFLGANGASTAGYFPIRTDEHNGVARLIDPVTKQALWEHREMLSHNQWYRLQYVPGKRDISAFISRDGKRIDTNYQFPTGAITTEKEYSFNLDLATHNYYRGQLDGKKLTILHQNKTPIFEMPFKSATRSVWCQMINDVVFAPLPDNHCVVLRVDGVREVEKPLFSGKLGQHARIDRVVGKYIIYTTTEHTKKTMITYCGILGVDGKKYVTLPFKDHVSRPARYASYQICAESKDTLVLIDPVNHELIAYRCRPAKP